MKLYDTLSGEKRDFVPQGDEVTIYVCGVTPYAATHVGHALSYVVFDVLRRYLEFQGHTVRHVENFTDIDDKIIERAQGEGVTIHDLASRHIQDYFDVMDALNVKQADLYPRATQEIPQMLEIISKLVEKGYAYPSDGDVYFRVQKEPDYGKLSHRTLEGMVAGSRIEVEANKEHPMDFVLWKKAKLGEPSWESPWGMGRPGWHIECTAMSLRYLGNTVDLHGGGQDLIFPHHENEIAQAEAYTGVRPFVNFWIHNGLLQLGEEKMSKSLGNLVSVKDALSTHSADALRLLFLTSHYRSPLTYTEEGVASSARALERLHNALQVHVDGNTDSQVNVDSYRKRFIAAMDDDLNTPQAIATLFDLAREINRHRETGAAAGEAQLALREMAAVLGLLLEELPGSGQKDAYPFIDLLVETRTQLRAERNWQLGDSIRSQLEELGVTLEDTPSGTQWRFKSPH
ncbi:cysteine--tRNA ligase [SAR202 cluster bacterium AC-647-N09_OGT_505m]|nr:cysteine--tRNA ligase [SAR202 cluster bacterium AC-647-N09_OGT_505m]